MNLMIAGILIMTLLMAVTKRMTSLIQYFALQSFFLFALMFGAAVHGAGLEVFIVAALLLLLKVVGVPWFLHRVVRRIGADENLGLLLNPTLSLFAVAGMTGLAYLFTVHVIGIHGGLRTASFVVSLTVILTGFFIMVVRMKALAQIVGLLVMENGLFLAAVAMCGGMPFLIEIALFFDILVCVFILGIFVYRINEVFTHIDVDKLTGLKG